MQTNSLIENYNNEIRDYIINFEEKDVHKLLLSKPKFDSIPNSELANQIECRRKAKVKLPSWYANDNIIYPPSVSLEQASSESTAQWKMENFVGVNCLDLTGGAGVDSYWFSKSFSQVSYVEKNSELVLIAKHNHNQLGADNISHYNNEASEFLFKNQTKWDLIYIDPSRRKGQSRVISIDNYEPDLLSILKEMQLLSKNILIKTSPMQDISDAFQKLGSKWNAAILVAKNECKELLFDWTATNKGGDVRICHLGAEQEDFEFNMKDETGLKSEVSEIKRYLYEPNAGIMKSGGFKSLTKKYNVSKLHENTNLFTSNELVEFPGRSFRVEATIPVSRKHLKELLPKMKANLSLRNFPGTVDGLMKQLSLEGGGRDYLFAITDVHNNQKLIYCSKVSTNRPGPGKY